MALEWLQHPPGGDDPDGPPEGYMFWVFAGTSVLLVLMAGLMSGLTLGLLSLDNVDMEVSRHSAAVMSVLVQSMLAVGRQQSLEPSVPSLVCACLLPNPCLAYL